MSVLLKVLLAAGGAAAAYFLLAREAFATEDESGKDVRPDEAEAPPMAPPSLPPGSFAAAVNLGLKAVEVLSRYIGKAKESPVGSNRGPVVDQIVRGVYGDGEKLLGKPWCARAARFAYEKAAEELGLAPPFAAIKGRLAAVTDWRDELKDWGLRDPVPGCVAVILHGGVRHAVLVSRVDGDNVYSVEGNHRNDVAAVKRPKSSFDGFYDVAAYARRPRSDRVSGYLVGVGLRAEGIV